jgi:hypothetical protein
MQLIKIGEPINIECKEKEVRPAIIKSDNQFYFFLIYDLSSNDGGVYRRFIIECERLQCATKYHAFFTMYAPTFLSYTISRKVGALDNMIFTHIINEDRSMSIIGERTRCTLKKAKQLYLKTHILYSNGGHDD